MRRPGSVQQIKAQIVIESDGEKDLAWALTESERERGKERHRVRRPMRERERDREIDR